MLLKAIYHFWMLFSISKAFIASACQNKLPFICAIADIIDKLKNTILIA